jgi:hypothetical protein
LWWPVLAQACELSINRIRGPQWKCCYLLFLFHFSVPCRYVATPFSSRGGDWFDEEYRLPSFAELDGRRQFADLRMAWNDEGIGFQLQIAGKKQPAWCRETRVEDSDGLQVWIDTRDTHNVHRANRFCHRFVFLPLGGGSRLDQPVAPHWPSTEPVSFAVEPKQLRVASTQSKGGYSLRCFIPASGLTGFDPQEHSKLGFSYAVVDRELGWQTFSVGPEFPIFEDPSLWGSVELIESWSRSGRNGSKLSARLLGYLQADFWLGR